MKRTRCLAAIIAASLPAAGALSCSAETGELVVVIQSDMELPKDIDTVRLEILSGGIPWHAVDYDKLGSDKGLKLPATIGITTPDDDRSRPVTIRVIARKGGEVRILREATTTIPSDRIAMYHMPFSFLCDGSAKEPTEGSVENSSCAAGETCVAGDCVPSSLAAPPPKNFEEGEVFGGGSGNGDGTCFDVTTCMEDGALATPVERDNPDAAAATEKPKVCSIQVDPAAGQVNLAILTETSGMCGETGCFVPLDAGTLTGWVAGDDKGTLILPDAVCRTLGEKVRGVVTAPLKPGCPLKHIETPTCGPWSSVGSGATPGDSKPVAHASGQHNPSSLVLFNGKDDDASEVLWTSRGLFTEEPKQKTRGAVKAAPITPGTVSELSSAEGMSARDIVVGLVEEKPHAFFTIASAEGGKGEIRRAALDGSEVKPFTMASAQNPEGIATDGTHVFWTEFTSGAIQSVDLEGNPGILVTSGDATRHPYRIVADKDNVCWTNEGSIHTTEMGNVPDGSIECANAGGEAPIAQVALGQNTPRAIALDEKGLYWATFEAMGSIRVAPRTGSTFGAPTAIATGQSFPNGIAVDATHIYWTTWGDGSVFRILKVSPDGMPVVPEKIASGQRKPAEIALNGKHIFWVNEGSAVGAVGTTEAITGDGAIVRLLKPN